MRHALPTGLVRVNLYVPKRREAGFDFLRLETEASSDSEVTRQALRYFEQLVQDDLTGIKLKVVIGSEVEWLTVARFRDDDERLDELDRRSIILHEKSMKRLNGIRAAMDAKDISAVVRCALRYYKHIVNLSTKDARFFAQLPSGEEYHVRMGIRTQIPSVRLGDSPVAR